MSSIQELLKQKEAELQQIKREIEALQIVARLLHDGADAAIAPQTAVLAPTPLAASPRANKSNGHDKSDVGSRQFP